MQKLTNLESRINMTRHPLPGTRYPLPGTCYSVPATRYTVPGTRYPVPATRTRVFHHADTYSPKSISLYRHHGVRIYNSKHQEECSHRMRASLVYSKSVTECLLHLLNIRDAFFYASTQAEKLWY